MTVTAEYIYGQDPRYGNIYVYLDEGDSPTLIVTNSEGNHGFEFRNGEMIPVCICSAHYAGECCCQTGNWE